MESTIEINAKSRTASVQIPDNTKTITFTVSREKCNDVLVEAVNKEGNAKGKPLNKYLPQFKTKGEVKELRFMMNDFSTKPITITIKTK